MSGSLAVGAGLEPADAGLAAGHYSSAGPAATRGEARNSCAGPARDRPAALPSAAGRRGTVRGPGRPRVAGAPDFGASRSGRSKNPNARTAANWRRRGDGCRRGTAILGRAADFEARLLAGRGEIQLRIALNRHAAGRLPRSDRGTATAKPTRERCVWASPLRSPDAGSCRVFPRLRSVAPFSGLTGKGTTAPEGDGKDADNRANGEVGEQVRKELRAFHAAFPPTGRAYRERCSIPIQ
jgi:hypothetical protein